MKTAVVYASIHHGNTKKLVEAMAQKVGLDLYDLISGQRPVMEEYDMIGFASGIYFQKPHKALKEYLEGCTFSGSQRVFLLGTCGAIMGDPFHEIKDLLARKGVAGVRHFCCRGYDTFGPFGWIGGIAKGHPNQKDIQGALEFYRSICEEL